MEIEIIKTDNPDIVIEKKTTETNIVLSELEAEIQNLRKIEADINEFNSWVDTLPDERRAFIQKQYFAVPQELVTKFNLIKESLNADNI
jgi:hypothetical protein